MVNGVRLLLSKIHNQIPPEILDLAFDTQGGRRSIDEEIIDKIIKAQLIPDCSAVAGQFKEIVLDPKWVVYSSIDTVRSLTTLPYAVYEIPDWAREYRRIVSVIGLDLPYGTSSSMAMLGGMNLDCQYSGASAGTFGEQAINGVTGALNIVMPQARILAYNKIVLEPMSMSIMTTYALVLSCRLEYDENFTNLTPDAVVELATLAVACTKAYIYNQLTVKLDMGVMKSGQEIGKIREIIDSYQDQQERYQVLLTEDWHGASEVLDVATLRQRFINGIFI